MSRNMFGYDTHGPQYPPEWDRTLPIHYDLDNDIECFDELVETKEGYWCPSCNQEVEP